MTFLVGTSRLVTCYKTNLSQSRDRSKNPVTLRKDPFPTVYNDQKRSLLFQKAVKTRLIEFDIEQLHLLKRQTKLLLNMTKLLNKTLNLAQQSLLYDSRSDRK